MRTLLVPLVVVVLPLIGVAAPAPDGDTAKGTPVEFDVYTSYFEKNDSGLKGDSSYVTLADREAFDKVFGAAATMKKQTFLPKNAFDKKMVVAVIKRGSALVEYKVEKATEDDHVLYLQYTTKTGRIGSATYRSPLIVTVPKDRFKSIVFIEDGKKAETLKVGK
jgi:hypothetical protein